MARPARTAFVLLVALVILVAAGCTSASTSGLHSASPAAEPTDAPTPTGTWLSGASGNGVTDGSFAAWRDRDLDIIGTWSDTGDNAQHFWQLRDGGALDDWNGPLDIAVGAIGEGETWAAAADGAYDATWASSLRTLAALRADATGTTYIRFAHEMNGDWYPWKVDRDDYKDFLVAWGRYRALQKQIFPSAKLVFSLNRQSTTTKMDWRRFFPGADEVDLISVDYYNQYPTISTAAEWKRSLDLVDQWGAPNGLEQFRAFARSKGLPLAISEWSGVASFGDSPAFVTGLLDYVRDHSGTGAGQIPYEILFDVPQDDNKFTLFGAGVKMPKSAAAYREFFAG